jgi:hypothetical protein
MASLSARLLGLLSARLLGLLSVLWSGGLALQSMAQQLVHPCRMPL